MKNSVENPSQRERKRNHNLWRTLVIGLLGSIILLAGCATEFAPEEIAERRPHVSQAATAQAKDDPILNTDGVLNTREAIEKFAFHDASQERSEYCSGVNLGIRTGDFDHNPKTPEETEGLFLTASHCLLGSNNNFSILFDGSIIRGVILEKRRLATTPNIDGDYPVFIKAKMIDKATKIESHGQDVHLVDGTDIYNTTVISCGYDYQITPNFPSDIYDQYCDYGIATPSISGYIKVNNMFVTVLHSGSPGMDSDGNINSITAVTSRYPEEDWVYFIPLPPNAEQTRQEMFP